MSKEKVEIKNHFPIVIAEESSVLRISRIRVDFERIEMVGQIHHGCGQPYCVFGRDLDVLRGSKAKSEISREAGLGAWNGSNIVLQQICGLIGKPASIFDLWSQSNLLW